METLTEFHARVDGFTHHSLPEQGAFITKPLLREKVAPDGRMRPFFGNTMIFDLPPDVQIAIARMQVTLHHRCASMLAEPLTPSTLHMTLHDLLNGTDEDALRSAIAQTGVMAKVLLRRQQEHPQTIRLTSTRAFNMTGGSVALGFAPDTEKDCAAIMALHGEYQQVVPLNYPLTPHVTLSYYTPGEYGEHQVHALADALDEIARMPQIPLTLTIEQLHYYTFRDMNTYIRG